MKKLFYIFSFLVSVSLVLTACSSDDDDDNTWEDYREWREANKTWFAEQSDKLDENGEPFYEKVAPDWAGGEYILMHWFNDRTETAGNLVPLLTSSVSTRYIGRLYDNTPVDSSYNRTDAIYTARVSNLIEGWQMALMNMHVGDTVQVVIPYDLGYGSSQSGSVYPYSALRFNMRLVDIPYYEARP